jgi:transcriptional regulator with XRE-family HTH domain
MSEIIPSPTAHKKLWASFGQSDYRHGFAFGFVRDYIAAQIAALRLHRSWNQGQLAKKAGVSQPQISKWENGGESIRLDSLQRLAEAFDVALVIKFVPFSELARTELGRQADARVPSFEDDSCEAITFGTQSVAFQSSPPRHKIRMSGTGGYARNMPVASGSGKTTVISE